MVNVSPARLRKEDKLFEIAKKFGLTRRKATQLFTDVSANMDDLKEVLVNNNEKLLWTQDEDEILDKCKENPNSAEYKLLVRIKGQERVFRRIKFNYDS